MQHRARIDHLIATAAPYWAGEAEVVRTYWSWSGRSVATDLLWLKRQCFKEFWGSGVGKFDRGGVFAGVMKNLIARVPEIDVTLDRREVLDQLEGLKAEFSHYCAFADVHDALKPADVPRIHPEALESWPEEDALTALRFRHQEQHGAIGLRACKFTEGGYCTLFSAGMALAGRPGIDGMIAEACAAVYEDEFDHMLGGIAGLGSEGLAEAEWPLLERLVSEQLRQRVRMRNAQFSRPLSPARLEAIDRGEIEPLAFDWRRAGLAAE